MGTIDIRLDSYYNDVNDTTSFAVSMTTANDELNPEFPILYVFDCSIGPLDEPNSVFPDIATAEAYFLNIYPLAIVGYVNFYRGTIDILGNIYRYWNSKLAVTLNAKADISSLGTTAFSNSYTDLSNKPVKSFSYTTRSLNSAFQPSSTRDTFVTYAVDISANLSLTGGQSGTVILEIADNSGFTVNVQTVNRSSSANTGTLTIGLNTTDLSTASVTGVVPAGKYARLRTVNNTGTPTFTYQSGQEVQFG